MLINASGNVNEAETKLSAGWERGAEQPALHWGALGCPPRAPAPPGAPAWDA